MLPYSHHNKIERGGPMEDDIERGPRRFDYDLDEEDYGDDEGDEDSDILIKRRQLSSPTRSLSGQTCQNLFRSRLVWLILALLLILIIICYENLLERMREMRLRDYMKQTEDLGSRLKEMDVELNTAQGKLKEMLQMKQESK